MKARSFGKPFPDDRRFVRAVVVQDDMNIEFGRHVRLDGYLTAWPSGTARPLASTLNALVPIATANASLVLAGIGGSMDGFASNATDPVIDLNGHLALPAAGGLSLYNVAPCRVLDTGRPAGSQPVSGTLDVNVIASPTWRSSRPRMG
jgi:hypothetical protein